MNLRRHALTLPSGTQISYLSGGPEDGLPVVLLHGAGVDHARLSWTDTFPALLALGCRVYAPDHPGYGHSPLPDWPVTLENLNRYLCEFMDALELERAALGGVSMGGGMALGYALEWPERVSRLVLIGSYGLEEVAPNHASSYWLTRVPGLTALNGLLARSPTLLRLTVAQIVRHPESLTPELLKQVADAMQQPDAYRAFTQFQRSEIGRTRLRTNFTARLPELSVPTLIVHGTEDIGVPLEAAQRAAALIPDARLRVFGGAGHWTQRDEPGRFNYELTSFLFS